MASPPIQFFTAKEVASMTRLTPETIRKLIDEGRIRATFLGHRAGWRITREDYDTFAESLMRDGL